MDVGEYEDVSEHYHLPGEVTELELDEASAQTEQKEEAATQHDVGTDDSMVFIEDNLQVVAVGLHVVHDEASLEKLPSQKHSRKQEVESHRVNVPVDPGKQDVPYHFFFTLLGDDYFVS